MSGSSKLSDMRIFQIFVEIRAEHSRMYTTFCRGHYVLEVAHEGIHLIPIRFQETQNFHTHVAFNLSCNVSVWLLTRLRIASSAKFSWCLVTTKRGVHDFDREDTELSLTRVVPLEEEALWRGSLFLCVTEETFTMTQGWVLRASAFAHCCL